MKDSCVLCACLGAFVSFVLTGFIASSIYDYKRGALNKVLLERGYAEWVVVDPASGRTELKIKECIE